MINFIKSKLLSFITSNQVRRIKSSVTNRKIAFIDIDNTLADTWPTLVSFKGNHLTRLASLQSFPRMVKMVNSLYEKGWYIILLTHRTLQQRKVTEQWLSKEKILHHQLIITSSPEEKIEVIKQFDNASEIFVIDDLSFGHETGKVQLYQEVIDALNKMKLIYIDKIKIDQFNQGKLESLW